SDKIVDIKEEEFEQLRDNLTRDLKCNMPDQFLKFNFSKHSMNINASIRFNNKILFKSIFTNVMRLFRLFSNFIDCNHGIIVLDMDMTIDFLEYNNNNLQNLINKNWNGYIEKDWGVMFSKDYMWAECKLNNYSTFFFLIGNQLFNFGCYTFCKIKEFKHEINKHNNNEIVTIVLKLFCTTVNISIVRDMSKSRIYLHAPIEDKMKLSVEKFVEVKISVKIIKNNIIIFEDESKNGDFEM
ncbi:25650_t:CDS:2, partial [Racocetra persica]